MLYVQHICKEYATGKMTHRALDDVSLNLRDNEFVAILGPSGSGKTTFLNIIGGLDHYDSGDLIINGISTKQYKDREWDSYRNHTIGFVFQNYNLIPHQTVLANVELALTISGIGKAKRRRMAREALEQVGLGDHINKRPNQLSGGQMQRVAIARALVNDPDILLADEPTGALDSDTSVQVMELLRKVAKDRLVVMVTHNPELAHIYATRIIELRDGKIRSDTDPFIVDELPSWEISNKKMGKSSMSFLTALDLSFHNLGTKKARTLLTSFAGSIGIIGIALILAASAGVNNYIANEEEAMIYEYPLEILSTTVDLNSLFSGNLSSDKQDPEEIGVVSTITKLFSTVGSNDLKALKTYFESNETDINEYTKAIEYSYNIVPQIFREDKDTYRQVNPDSSMDVISTGILSADASPISGLFNTDVFFQLPENESIYKGQYEIRVGRWPQKYNECVVVLSADGGISDVMMYALGLRDSLELERMLEQFTNGANVDVPDDYGTYSYEDIMNVSFQLAAASDYYQYDSEYKTWIDKTDDASYMNTLVKNGETLRIVGIVQPMDEEGGEILDAGIYYPASLTEYIVQRAKESNIVKEQLADPETDVFTGEPFGKEPEEEELNLSGLFSIDSNVLTGAFRFDSSSIEDRLSDILSSSMKLDPEDVSKIFSENENTVLEGLTDSIDQVMTADNLNKIAADMLAGYKNYVSSHPEADLTKLQDSFMDYLSTDEARKILSNNIAEIIRSNGDITMPSNGVEELVQSVLEGYLDYVRINGYTDSQKAVDYLKEYMQTQTAQDIINKWAADNLNVISDISVSQEQMKKLLSELMTGYKSYASTMDLPDPSKTGDYFADYLHSDEAQQILISNLEKMVNTESLTEQLSFPVTEIVNQLAGQISDNVVIGLKQQSGQMKTLFSDSVTVDPEAFISAFQMNMNSSELLELLMSLSSSYRSTCKDNLEKLGYADFDDPHSIVIYPTDFQGKEHVINILDDYNLKMQENGNEDQIISYSDTSATLMSSMTEIINIISYVMIGVVAISLVVSSIMIGVITYISVLERKKEIGILRALGASKGNISQVFNAETVIIGLCAGLLGIGISYLLIIPANILLRKFLEVDALRVFLPVKYAFILVVISVALTLISGLIPSTRAAKNDPVEALRTE